MAYLPPKSTGGVKIVTIAVIFTLSSVLAVGLRIVAASIRRRNFRLHDYLAFAALVRMSRMHCGRCTEDLQIFTVGFGVNAIIGKSYMI